MYLIKRLTAWMSSEPNPQVSNNRQYKFINTVSIELIFLGLLLSYINLSLELWWMLYPVIVACLLAIINLFILKKTNNTVFCGHLLTMLALIVVTLANYGMGGLSTAYFGWYYVVPILAAVTIGRFGLLIYAAISLALIGLFALINVTPVYELSPANALLMSVINRFFSLLIVVTTLYSMLRDNAQYEKMLQEHNYLLQADKEKFHYLARYDTLTNLPNRSYFQTYTQTIIESAKIQHHCVTIFFMDLDELKEVNDRYGHDVGDALLLLAGKRLLSCFRDNDFLARLGGDEFTGIIKHLKEEDIPEAIAKRILQEFNKPFEIAARKLHCSISIGLASYPLDTLNADELVRKADKAMYEAKKAGGNTYRVTKKVDKIFS
jgi:diguanylate cyclase (GGDEF)-like protein